MNAPVLELRQLSKTFHRRGAAPLRAVDNVSLHVDESECVALVGESGSGKSTLARMALQLMAPDRGDVLLRGHSLMHIPRRELRAARLSMQPIFQDPASSFNPRRTVAAILSQAVAQLDGTGISNDRITHLLERVELRPAGDYLARYPHELSGGQQQRLSIARAIATQPAVIIADEPLSGADVSIRAQILNLMVDLQRDSGVAYLLVTHDMLVAQAFSHRIAVMYQGRIVEQGSTRDVLAAPLHPYTRNLIAAVQSLDEWHRAPPTTRKQAAGVPHRGCAYSARCSLAKEICEQTSPLLREVHAGHFAACHFAEGSAPSNEDSTRCAVPSSTNP